MGSTIIGGVLASAPSGLSALEIVTNAFAEINAFDPGMAIPDADSSFGLSKLNRLIDLWNAKKQYLYYHAHETFAFTTSRTSYTIGAESANFDADRPMRLVKANLIIGGTSPSQRIPLEVMDLDLFSDLAVVEESGEQPAAVFYKPTYPNGTLYPYPYPSGTAASLANSLELFYLALLTKCDSLSTVITLPPGYEEAITLTLAESLCGPYEKQISDDLKVAAARARAAIASVNSVPPRIQTRDNGIPTAEEY